MLIPFLCRSVRQQSTQHFSSEGLCGLEERRCFCKKQLICLLIIYIFKYLCNKIMTIWLFYNQILPVCVPNNPRTLSGLLPASAPRGTSWRNDITSSWEDSRTGAAARLLNKEILNELFVNTSGCIKKFFGQRLQTRIYKVQRWLDR